MHKTLHHAIGLVDYCIEGILNDANVGFIKCDVLELTGTIVIATNQYLSRTPFDDFTNAHRIVACDNVTLLIRFLVCINWTNGNRTPVEHA